ncbi:MAG: hypothetical protein TRG1_3534 [Flavobacteriaceae bacterium FS1-H7996/R]|nr:MAG: hypothetical protein TRG1_3534 [Flavobacteriaceae bacterium FS1-H7996/R]
MPQSTSFLSKLQFEMFTRKLVEPGTPKHSVVAKLPSS